MRAVTQFNEASIALTIGGTDQFTILIEHRFTAIGGEIHKPVKRAIGPVNFYDGLGIWRLFECFDLGCDAFGGRRIRRFRVLTAGRQE